MSDVWLHNSSFLILVIAQQVLEFVQKSTANFDSSHNHQHALEVYTHAIDIIEDEMKDYDVNLITFASLLHDVCDHKYPESIPYDEL